MMDFPQAKKIIQFHALGGIAYTSRFGEYPSREKLSELTDALALIVQVVCFNKNIEKELAGWLLVLPDQIQGNFNGALQKGIVLKYRLYRRRYIYNQ